MKEFIFTFGFNQKLPDGKDATNGYVSIRAENSERAREEMIREYGYNWAFQYDSKEAAGVEKYNLWDVNKLHGRKNELGR